MMKLIREMAKQRGFEFKALSTPEQAKGIAGFKSAEVVADSATYKILSVPSEREVTVEVIVDGWSEREWTLKTEKAAAEKIRTAEWLAEHRKAQQ